MQQIGRLPCLTAMTRNDLRLVLVIVSTAAISSIGSVALWRAFAPAPEPPPVAKVAPAPRVDLTPVENRLAEVEVRIAALEAPKVPDTCDEVECVLVNYDKACCAKFDRHLPEAIDRDMIAQAITEARGQIMACGPRTDVKGQVVVRAKVEPDGSVAEVVVMVTPDVGLGHCVAEQLQLAHFAPTQHGGTFRYPFEF